LEVSEEKIAEKMALRRPQGAISTGRQEPDPVQIVSGVYQGKTTGTPLCILIPNLAQRSSDYEKKTKLRPGHADFTAELKYHGFQDPRGGGHFSGRITAPLVAAGAILLSALERKGILIGTHIAHLAGIADRSFRDLEKEVRSLGKMPFGVLSSDVEEAMQSAILEAKKEGDSVGGVLETCVLGMPGGVGEPWFDTLESLLSHALFAIPAVKGVEFGGGFSLTKMRGSQANDAFCLSDGKIVTRTNQNGGINGGISNGMPILFRTAIKPTPTLSLEQDTVDLATGEETTLSSGGRHDPCIVHRARVVQDCVTALVLCDALTQRFGTDYLAEGKEQ